MGDIFSYEGEQAAGPATSETTGLTGTLEATTEKWDEDIVTVATLQNPALPPRDVQSATNQTAVARWASRNDIPTLDVTSAFPTADALAPVIIDDGLGVHPNDDGQRLWAEFLAKELG